MQSIHPELIHYPQHLHALVCMERTVTTREGVAGLNVAMTASTIRQHYTLDSGCGLD
jgi:hypothetical protein